jgi:hypothetical protein
MTRERSRMMRALQVVAIRRTRHGPSTFFDRTGMTARPRSETHLGVRLQPQAVSKSLIEHSTVVPMMAGFPIPFGMSLRIRECLSYEDVAIDSAA